MKLAESVVGQGLIIEGKVEGNGSIRLAGRLKGQVAVTGDVTVDPEGTIEGDVKADRVRIAGHAAANILAASAVEVTGSASLVGEVKAPTVQVIAGAKIRGHIVSGWTEEEHRDQSDVQPSSQSSSPKEPVIDSRSEAPVFGIRNAQ